MNEAPVPAADVLIIGAGAAGLGLALRLPQRLRVVVVAKAALTQSSSYYAQGGISAVLDKEDSIESHAADTLAAGAGLCDPDVVRQVVSQAPDCIRWLVDLGVPFTQERRPDGRLDYHLTREGGHSHRRVAHAADATGQAIQTHLARHAQARSHIAWLTDHIAVDLIASQRFGLGPPRCLGAYLFDRRTGQVRAQPARVVVLATGGASKVYLYTSNPDGATGDGIAMAWRAGCRVANMEFMQFHPTCLYHPKAKSFLITEAVRGEGGRLLLPDGKPFMQHYDPRAELAPRDVVARAIDHEMKRLGADHVLLDISHRSPAFIREHFPNVYARCLEFGYDLAHQPVPVVPAAHYTCGGVVTDHAGRSDLPGLYVIGESACTGLHGANRMASNSLLECLVYAGAAAADLERSLAHWPAPPLVPVWDESRVTDSDEQVVVSHNWGELRRCMWDYVGVVRTDKRLQRARRRVALLLQEIADYYGNFRITADLIELRNLTVVADLIIAAAQARRESRGLHYTADYPEIAAGPPQHTILLPQSPHGAADSAEQRLPRTVTWPEFES